MRRWRPTFARRKTPATLVQSSDGSYGVRWEDPRPTRAHTPIAVRDLGACNRDSAAHETLPGFLSGCLPRP